MLQCMEGHGFALWHSSKSLESVDVHQTAQSAISFSLPQLAVDDLKKKKKGNECNMNETVALHRLLSLQ